MRRESETKENIPFLSANVFAECLTVCVTEPRKECREKSAFFAERGIDKSMVLSVPLRQELNWTEEWELLRELRIGTESQQMSAVRGESVAA